MPNSKASIGKMQATLMSVWEAKWGGPLSEQKLVFLTGRKCHTSDIQQESKRTGLSSDLLHILWFKITGNISRRHPLVPKTPFNYVATSPMQVNLL